MPCSTSNSITRRSDDPGKNARARSGRSANAASTAVRPIQLTAALVSATRISLNHLSSDGLGSSGSTNVQATMSGCRSTAVRNDFNTCRFCAAVRRLKKLLISKTWSPADPRTTTSTPPSPLEPSIRTAPSTVRTSSAAIRSSTSAARRSCHGMDSTPTGFHQLHLLNRRTCDSRARTSRSSIETAERPWDVAGVRTACPQSDAA
jgi:hypothetical protein